jgi:hypothetical protein
MPILGANSSGGSRPSAPVIGSATDGGTGTTASVAFTPSTYIGKGTITYTATSSPGNFTATSSSSPITVTGLTAGTAYTFTVQGTTNYGITSATSSASNSVTPLVPTAFESIATYTSPGSNSVTFSGISSTYRHLQIRSIARNTDDGNGGPNRFNLSINGNTSGASAYMRGNGTAASTSSSGSMFVHGAVMGDAVTANFFASSIVDFYEANSTSKKKSIMYQTSTDFNTSGGEVNHGRIYFDSTSAISSITVTANGGTNFKAGTIIALYGIKG